MSLSVRSQENSMLWAPITCFFSKIETVLTSIFPRLRISTGVMASISSNPGAKNT
jgi:hypothetical protein